jgi:hypothetical protein
LKKKDLEEGKLLKVDIHDKSLVLTSIKGNYYAMDQFVPIKADLYKKSGSLLMTAGSCEVIITMAPENG